jgi:hypothetical protein
MTPTLGDLSRSTAVSAEITDIPYMEGWPALLVLLVVMVAVGLRNPYRHMLGNREPPRLRRRRGRATRSSTGRKP